MYVLKLKKVKWIWNKTLNTQRVQHWNNKKRKWIWNRTQNTQRAQHRYENRLRRKHTYTTQTHRNRQTDKECAWGRPKLLLVKRQGWGFTLCTPTGREPCWLLCEEIWGTQLHKIFWHAVQRWRLECSVVGWKVREVGAGMRNQGELGGQVGV